MGRWQPIETAPKDCTVIIGMYVKSYGPPEHEKWCESASMMWEGGPGRIAGGYWSYTGYSAGTIPKKCQPTHWMISPEPPETTEKTLLQMFEEGHKMPIHDD